jgi:hypothetical protein
LNGIGTLQEKSLHAALKQWYARPGDQFEVTVGDYVIDIVRGDLLIEIQTRNFFAMKRKLTRLLGQHRLRLVHPIAQEKWIHRVQADGVTTLGRRRSSKRGSFAHVFNELVSFPQLITHPNFSLELLLVREEEIRSVGGTSASRRRRRWRKDWQVADHRLIEVLDRRAFETANDYRAFLPGDLSASFTNAEVAEVIGIPRALAQKMTYCLSRAGVIKAVGKRGRSILYSM